MNLYSSLLLKVIVFLFFLASCSLVPEKFENFTNRFKYAPHGSQTDFVGQVGIVVEQGDEQETGERVHWYAVPVHAQAQAAGRAAVQ